VPRAVAAQPLRDRQAPPSEKPLSPASQWVLANSRFATVRRRRLRNRCLLQANGYLQIAHQTGFFDELEDARRAWNACSAVVEVQSQACAATLRRSDNAAAAFSKDSLNHRFRSVCKQLYTMQLC